MVMIEQHTVAANNLLSSYGGRRLVDELLRIRRHRKECH